MCIRFTNHKVVYKNKSFLDKVYLKRQNSSKKDKFSCKKISFLGPGDIFQSWGPGAMISDRQEPNLGRTKSM